MKSFGELTHIHQNIIVYNFTSENQHTYGITTSVDEVTMCLSLCPREFTEFKPSFSSDRKNN